LNESLTAEFPCSIAVRHSAGSRVAGRRGEQRVRVRFIDLVEQRCQKPPNLFERTRTLVTVGRRGLLAVDAC